VPPGDSCSSRTGARWPRDSSYFLAALPWRMALREHADRVVARVEVAWTDGDLSVVKDLVHEDAVLAPWEGGPSYCGRELFLRFFRRTTNFTFERVEPGGSCQIWEHTVVFQRSISCSTRIGGAGRSVGAREVWVLARCAGLWSVVWHTTCALPSPT
jgi:hypothetical protein